jgi:hypothetical protein
MGAAASEKSLHQAIVLQGAKMKQSLAAHQPAYDGIQQDPLEGKQGVGGFKTSEFGKGLSELDPFQIIQQDFDSSQMGSML